VTAVGPGWAGRPDHPLRHRDADAIAATVAARREKAVGEWRTLAEALGEPSLTRRVDAAGAAVASALAAGGSLLVAGNGGSAAMASHIAAELVGKCVQDRRPLPAVNLGESLSSITAVGNDYGFDEVFTRGVAAHGRAGDVLLALTTSGRSQNVLSALVVARELGLVTIALTGAAGGALEGRVDHLLQVPSDDTPRIQEVHLMWAHAWCEAVDLLSDPEAP